MNLLFLSILVISAFAIIRGWIRGLIGLAYGVFSWIFMLIFVALANPIMYNYMMTNSEIHSKVYDFAYPYADAAVPKIPVPKKTSPKNSDDEKSYHLDKDYIDKSGLPIPGAIKDLIPDGGVDVPADIVEKAANGNFKIPEEYSWVADELESYGIPVDDALEAANGSMEEIVAQMRKKAVASAAEEATKKILKGASIFFCYLIAKVLCLIVRFSAFALMKIGPINIAMRVAGACVGALEAMLYAWVVLSVIYMARLSPPGEKLYAQVEENPLLLSMYEANPIRGIFEIARDSHEDRDKKEQNQEESRQKSR